MRDIKGFFRDFHGKRVWVPEHLDKREAAAPEPPKPAPKNLKPVNPAPIPLIKNPDEKLQQHHHHEHQPWKDNHFGATKPKPWTSEPFQDPSKVGKGPGAPSKDPAALKKPWGWMGSSGGASHPAPPEYNPKPKYTPEEELAYFLKHNPHAKLHPKKDEKGGAFYIKHPSEATGSDTWKDKTAMATFLPDGEAPKALNKVKFAPWTDHPNTDAEWNDVAGQDPWLNEPPLKATMAAAAGVVIEEPDGRVWVVHPSNQFAGYEGTFPKGHADHGLPNLQATAIREAYEESGMKVEITGFLGDVDRTATTTRYYTARRVGGTPTDCGWETQAVSLVPRILLYSQLNSHYDHGLAEMLGAGPAPKPKYEPLPPFPKHHIPEGDYMEPVNWWEGEGGF